MRSALLLVAVFSLLELAEEGGRIPVDYTLPLVELAQHVLTANNC